MIYFAPVRREMAAKGFSEATIGALEAIARTAQSASDAASGGGTGAADIAALNAEIAALRIEIAAARQAAEDAPLLVPPNYFNPDDVKQVITDPGVPLFSDVPAYDNDAAAAAGGLGIGGVYRNGSVLQVRMT